MKQKKINKASNARRKVLILIALILAGIVFIIICLEKTGAINLSLSNSTLPDNSINYQGPTNEEKATGDQQKNSVEKREQIDKNISMSENSKNAVIVITDAAQYGNKVEVRAFISNVYENGTCTYTFRQDLKKVIKESPAYKDVTTTVCADPMINRSDFGTDGTWLLSVNFKSVGSSGQSQELGVVIK